MNLDVYKHESPPTASATSPAGRARSYWRSLDELAETPSFRRWLDNEFPPAVAEKLRGPSRREVLRLMGASFALAGLTRCNRPPPESIVPRVRSDQAAPRAKPLYFATSLTLDGYAQGALVESYMGRPIKIEGNPDHPASLGATDVFRQAALLEFYDPDRSQALIHQGDISTWRSFSRSLASRLELANEKRGKGLHLLTGPTTSPTLLHQISRLLDRWPDMRWYVHAPIGRSNTLDGASSAFGHPAEPVLRLDAARVIVSLDDDFLYSTPGHLRYAREFADARRITAGQAPTPMNRLYVAEPSPTVTGATADHRLSAKPSQIGAIAVALWQQLQSSQSPVSPGSVVDRLPERIARWIRAVADEIMSSPGRSLVTVGESQPPAVHALGHAINVGLGNVGKTVDLISHLGSEGRERAETLGRLVEAMEAGRVETLLVLDANPVYDGPADLRLTRPLLERAAWSAHLGLYRNETARACQWHVPMSHELESWGDARAFDGTAGILQPLIHPLYDGRSPLDLVGQMLGDADVDPLEQVKRFWAAQQAATGTEAFWQTALRRGAIEATGSPALTLTLRPEAIARAARTLSEPLTEVPGPASENESDEDLDALELHFSLDPNVWNGRFANNGWLQELPKPITKLTWDNAAMLSPATAREFGLDSGQIVELIVGERTLFAPVWITPGQNDRCITLSLGYGRRAAGRVGTGIGVDAYALRTATARWSARGLTLRATGRRHALAVTQHHHLIDDDELIKAGSFAAFQENPASIVHEGHSAEALSLYPPWPQDAPQWGMVIDLHSCIGCNACVLACQAENNIPIVGKEEVIRGREMHWIRVDRYYEGHPADPRIHHQPVPCMHCENAPCEVVCPVNATTHSRDGLNEMTYNRCIGTRYCSNNCPYKVRRFNFLDYTDDETPSLRLLRNPDVTVRGRGVMEKCTYCVQRIRQAQIDARKEKRAIAEGEVVTACQQVCPTRAIIFGDIRDPNSAVSVARRSPLHYGLLAHLNTRPRTTYLAAIRHENSRMSDDRRSQDPSNETAPLRSRSS